MALVPLKSSIAIGIDLGTTYSCVGAYINEQVVIIPTDGEHTCPSYVSINQTNNQSDVIVGHAAKDRAHLAPEHTFFDAKRLIGRRFDDSIVQQDMRDWPFTVKPASNNEPLFAIPSSKHNQETLYRPQQISAFVLAHLKKSVEKFLSESEQSIDQSVVDAVITVPAYFSDAQRAATKEAGELAGLNVIRVINEPTAAAIAYGLHARLADQKGEKHILIFDLGGGTFDVSLLSIEAGIFEVKATAGDTHLGGQDFDARIMKWVVQQIRSINQSILPEDDAQAVRQLDELSGRTLRIVCEQAKRDLSSAESTTITLRDILPVALSSSLESINKSTISVNQRSLILTLSRSAFETMCADLFKATLHPVEQVLRDAMIGASQIDEIVLVGGSTRIPRIQSLLVDFFNGKPLNNSIDPDEAVAFGATIQAAMLLGHIEDNSSSSILLIDVAPLSLGVEVAGGLMNTLIARNSTIPCRRTRTFTTHVDYQSEVSIQVFEGERVRTCSNLLLGSFELGPLPRSEAGKLKIEVTFTLDANGILSVTASETSTGTMNSICVSCKDRVAGNDEDQSIKFGEIARILEESALHAESDSAIAARSNAMFGLQSFVLACRRKLRQDRQRWESDDAEQVEARLEETERWIEKIEQDQQGDEKTFEDKQAELEAFVLPFLTKCGLLKVQQRMEELAKSKES